MSNVIEHPGAPATARETEVTAEHPAEAARGEIEQAERVQKVWDRVLRDAEGHILGVVYAAAEEVCRKTPREPCAHSEAAEHAVYLAALNVARFAVEAAMAKVAGYETWPEVDAAIDARAAAFSEEQERVGIYDGVDICNAS